MVGGIVGGLVGFMAGSPCGAGNDGLGCKKKQISMGSLGASVGCGLGLLIAFVGVPERWATVSPASVRVGVTRLPSGRLGLGAALAL